LFSNATCTAATGRELYGAGGEDGTDLGARTKTKARARAAQDAIDAAVEEGVWAADEDARDSASGDMEEEEGMVEEEMVVRKRAPKVASKRTQEDVLSFGWKGMDLGEMKLTLNPLMARVLGQRAAEVGLYKFS
jgi:hypothetical protein